MSNQSEVEILLVEDNPDDAEMAIRALRKSNIANHMVHVADGRGCAGFHLWARRIQR